MALSASNIEDIHMTIENLKETEFSAIEQSCRMADEEFLQKEKQISVDPISLRKTNSRLLLPPIITGPKVTGMHPPPLLPPAKPKFLSSSLPNSATSSPRFGSILSKKKLRNQFQAVSPLQVDHMQRSKSCGEGRDCAPAMDEFNFRFSKGNGAKHGSKQYDSFRKTEAANKSGEENVRNMDAHNDEFKCGSLCMFLPGFGKGKPVRPRKEAEMENVISRTVSLEKFECGSWSSSAIMHGNDDLDAMNLYFDLPLELIRSTVNDANSPVTTAFVFNKDRKGVLKNGTAGKSHELPRHVHFSTSSPASHPASPSSCITPRH